MAQKTVKETCNISQTACVSFPDENLEEEKLSAQRGFSVNIKRPS